MIHYVVEAVDRGGPVLRQEIKIEDGESLSKGHMDMSMS